MVDTGGRCNGKCCTDITLRLGTVGQALSWEEVEERQRVGATQMLEENHLERFLVRGSERDHFDCRNFKGGRCSIYDARPETCRTYPLNTIQNEQPSNTCRHCGYDATHTEKS